jgi:hypothetical protein
MSAIPTITMHKVESSQFAAIGHVPELNLLAIQFHPKKSTGLSDIYHYEGVSADMFAEFLGAESQGSFFIQRIKKDPALFPYSKVDQALFNHTAPAPVVESLAESVAAPALTKELLAVALSGREYPFDLTDEEQAQAKAAGLVVIFGASDDLMELRGAINDEFSCYDGGTALIDAKGLLPDRENIEGDDELKDFFAREPLAHKVEALSCEEGDYTWTYRTSIPHATFDVTGVGGPYCRGIVISVADLGGAA